MPVASIVVIVGVTAVALLFYYQGIPVFAVVLSLLLLSAPDADCVLRVLLLLLIVVDCFPSVADDPVLLAVLLITSSLQLLVSLLLLGSLRLLLLPVLLESKC
jgi:hypothetical protein